MAKQRYAPGPSGTHDAFDGLLCGGGHRMCRAMQGLAEHCCGARCPAMQPNAPGFTGITCRLRWPPLRRGPQNVPRHAGPRRALPRRAMPSNATQRTRIFRDLRRIRWPPLRRGPQSAPSHEPAMPSRANGVRVLRIKDLSTARRCQRSETGNETSTERSPRHRRSLPPESSPSAPSRGALRRSPAR